jgi:hypothetical protein
VQIPTVGRILHVYRTLADGEKLGPFAAMVIGTRSSLNHGNKIKLSVFIPGKANVEMVFDVGSTGITSFAVGLGVSWNWSWPPKE